MYEKPSVTETNHRIIFNEYAQSEGPNSDSIMETDEERTKNKEKNVLPIWEKRPDLTWIYREGWPKKLQFWGRVEPEIFKVLRSGNGDSESINNLVRGISKLAEDPKAQDQFYLTATLDDRFEVLTKENLSKEEIDVVLHNAFLWGHKVDIKYLRQFWEKASQIDSIQNPLLFERVLINFLSYLSDSPSLLEATDLWREAANKIPNLSTLTEVGCKELLEELKNRSIKTILATVNTETLKGRQKLELGDFVQSLIPKKIPEQAIAEFLTDVAHINDERDGIGPKVELGIEEANEVLDNWDFWHELLSRGVKPNSSWWERKSISSLTVLQAVAEHKKELLRDLAFLEGIGIRNLEFYRPHIYTDGSEEKNHQSLTAIDTNLCRSFLAERSYYLPEVEISKKVVLHMAETHSFDSMLTALFQMPAFRGKVEEAGNRDDLIVYTTLIILLADHLAELNINHPYLHSLAKIVNRDFQLVAPSDYWVVWHQLANFIDVNLERRPNEFIFLAEEMVATGLHPKAFYPYGYDYIKDGKFHDIRVYDTSLRGDKERRVRYERLMRLGALHLIEKIIQAGRQRNFQDNEQNSNHVRTLKTAFLYFVNPNALQDKYIKKRFWTLMSKLEESDPEVFHLIEGEKLKILLENLSPQGLKDKNWVELQLLQLEIGAGKYLGELFEAADLGDIPEVDKNQPIGISINVHVSDMLSIFKSGWIELPLVDKRRTKDFYDRYKYGWNSRVYISKRGALAHEGLLGDAIYGALYDPTLHKYGGVSVSFDKQDIRLQRYGAHFFVLDPNQSPPFTVTPWDSFTDIVHLSKGSNTLQFLPGKYPYIQQVLAFQRRLVEAKGVEAFNNMSPGFYTEVQLYPTNGVIPLNQIKELHISWDHLKEETGGFMQAVKVIKEIKDKASKYGLAVFVFKFDKFGNKTQKKIV